MARLISGVKEIPKDPESLGRALNLLGHKKFRPGQLAPVMSALNGDSVLLVLPTGSGKSLCYQVPGLLKPGTSLVFSPLRALMVEQAINLHRKRIPATYINSDLSKKEKDLRFELHERGAWSFLFVTPERFNRRRKNAAGEIAQIAAVKPSFIVVDETHVVERWGQDFRPMYGELRKIRSRLGDPPVIALTASAGLDMQDSIVESIGVPDAKRFVNDVDRPNIGLIRCTTAMPERFNIIERLIRTSPGKMMIFVPTRRIGDELKSELLRRGLHIPFYFGDLEKMIRQSIINRLSGTEGPPLQAVVCTNALGMGMDIPDVRVVIHWSQPESVEDYLQEFGRAGRDGNPAIAVVFDGETDDTDIRRHLAKRATEESDRSIKERQRLLAAKEENIQYLSNLLTDRTRCFRERIVSYFERPREKTLRHYVFLLVEWLLAETSHKPVKTFCCDVCNPEVSRSIITSGFPEERVLREVGTKASRRLAIAGFVGSGVVLFLTAMVCVALFMIAVLVVA